MATAALRTLDNASGLSGPVQEIMNWNFWAIQAALNSVGAATPGNDPVIPEVIIDGLADYLKLSGRSTGQIIQHYNYATTAVMINASAAFAPPTVTDPPSITPALHLVTASATTHRDLIYSLRITHGSSEGFRVYANTSEGGALNVTTVRIGDPTGDWNCLYLIGNPYSSLNTTNSVYQSPKIVGGRGGAGFTIAFPDTALAFAYNRSQLNLVLNGGNTSQGWDDITHTSSVQRVQFGTSNSYSSRVQFASSTITGATTKLTRLGIWTDSVVISDRATSKLPAPLGMFNLELVANQIGLTIKASDGQGEDLLEIRDSTGLLLSAINNLGWWVGPIHSSSIPANVALKDAAQTFTRAQTIFTTTDEVALTIKPYVLLTENIVEVYDTALNLVFAVANSGAFGVSSFTVYNGAVGDPDYHEFYSLATGFKEIYFPNLTGTVALVTGAQTITSKTFTNCTMTGSGNVLTTGVRIRASCVYQDSSDISKEWTINGQTITPGTTRLFNVLDVGGVFLVVGDDAAGAVDAGRMGKVDIVGQTASIGSTALTNSPPVGLYRVEVIALCTTAGTAGTLKVSITSTDSVGSHTEDLINTLDLSATGRLTGSASFLRTSGDISYSTTVTGATGSPQYALYIRITYLG